MQARGTSASLGRMRTSVARELSAFVFVDEMGTNTSLATLYAWTPHDERARKLLGDLAYRSEVLEEVLAGCGNRLVTERADQPSKDLLQSLAPSIASLSTGGSAALWCVATSWESRQARGK